MLRPVGFFSDSRFCGRSVGQVGSRSQQEATPELDEELLDEELLEEALLDEEVLDELLLEEELLLEDETDVEPLLPP